MIQRIKIISLVLVAAALSGSAFGAIVLSDAQWMSATISPQASVTDIPGDPGLLVVVDNSSASGEINVFMRDFGGADLSASGSTFEVELENLNTVPVTFNPVVQNNAWSNWDQDWFTLAAGESRKYTVNVRTPTNVNRIYIQIRGAPAGTYTFKIKGGIVDFSASDPDPKDGGKVGVISTGNRLYWTNHSIADPVAGSNLVTELFISTDANDLYNNPKTTRIPGLTNFGDVQLVVGKNYAWGVKATEPDGVTVYTSPVWKFDAVQRVPRTRYEAEYSTIIPGDTAPQVRNVGIASGGKIIWTNWGGVDRGSFVFDVMMPADGTYHLTIHYAIDGTTDRGDKIQINGVAGGDTMFPGTSGAYSDLVVPVTLKKGVNTLGIVTSWGGISYDYFELNLDDMTATNPSPKVGEVILVGNNTLSWTRHSVFDPKYTSDTKCTVYLGTTEPNPALPHYGYSAIATDITASSIPVTLDWGNNYYWVVDSTVPVDPNSVTFPGYLWRFTTVDPKPVVTIDATKIIGPVRRMVPVWLKPTVTDQGKPGLSYQWELTGGPEGVAIGDICADPAAQNPQFTFTKVGLFTLALSVTDGSDNVTTASIDITVVEYYRALRLECEDGTIVPGDTAPQLRTDENASGNQVVWSNWSGTDRGSLVIDANVPNLAGTYDMVFHYRVDGSGARGDKWQVNGTQLSGGDTMFAGTNGAYEDLLIKNVTLIDGTNQIKMLTSWGGMWYDYIEFPAIKAPLAAYNPIPEMVSTVPSTLSQLSWSVDPNSAESVITSTVYIGTAAPDFKLPDYGMTKIAGDTGTSAIVSDLLMDTTYYWLVEYTDSELPGQVFRSATWRFMTIDPCIFFALVGDLDHNCRVNFDDLMILAGAWMAAENGYLLEDLADLAAHWMTCIDPETGLPTGCAL